MWAGFQSLTIQRDGVTLFARQGGPLDSGRPPLLLLHGHPQTMAMWHRVAPVLARTRRVVLMDLRGYGDSDRPLAGEGSAAYAKREMALDAMALMQSLGHGRFDVLAHDRGARVAHRLALDHPQAVARLLLLDIAPTLAMYEGTTETFSRAYWHWFFLIQPAPLPERLIHADPLAYLRDGMGRRGGAFFAPEAWTEYERCIARPGTAAAICADYRASAGIDLDHDRSDRAAGRRVVQPLRVLWGANGVVGRCFAPLKLWQSAADNVSGRAVDSGHYIAEEAPDVVLAEAAEFFDKDDK
ncbi:MULTISPECIES: alpha/beta fold hydrolase [unclassified Roseateles]|uniref:alpha/beta fold hydrolase n=1 Tax=unclassified Roseateles TaxID=2626991 RepID=UPI0006F4FB36|nr:MULTISPECIES: alpha/beta hydrolase [unclassified Roseateles]KQW51130.1 alpha/beta hydrolase [Pelomonas sp. Root405]KRA77362.1 alpha/beta hydrolase [Pelomonas sp. Root662]